MIGGIRQHLPKMKLKRFWREKMSKNINFSEEKDCKCCHEWWFASDIKQDLCPNCYDYFKQLKQQLAKKDCRIEELEGQFAYECECNKQLVELQKQLAEKDKEIDKYFNFFLCNIADLTKTDIETLVFNNGNIIIQNQTQLAIQKLEEVNGILTDTIIEVTQDELYLNKLCYLEEISAKFYEKIQQQIKELKERF